MPPLLVGAAIAVVQAWRARDRVRLTLGRARAVALMIAVAAMTQAGFAGNLRYVALPAALVCVLAGAGWVDLVRGARARFGRRSRRRARRAPAGRDRPVRAPGRAASCATTSTSCGPSPSSTTGCRRSSPRRAGADALLRCGPVYTPPFEVQAVAWAMHVHSSQVGIFAAPPGTTLGGHFSALGHDPRFPEITKNRRWIVGRNCRGATP